MMRVSVVVTARSSAPKPGTSMSAIRGASSSNSKMTPAVMTVARQRRTLTRRQRSSFLLSAYSERTGTSAALSMPPMSIS